MTDPVQTDTRRDHAASLFVVGNASEVSVRYRLLRVENVPRDDHYDKNLGRLLRDVQFEVRAPVALVHRAGDPFLALPTSASEPAREQRLMPHVAILNPDPSEYVLNLGNLGPADRSIGVSFLQWAIRGSLFTDRDVWSQGRCYYTKGPLSKADGTSVDVYPGFSWNVLVLDDGRPAITVDVTSRFVDSAWITERISRQESLRGRNCLYHFGHQWFVIQVRGVVETAIDEYQFWPDKAQSAVSLYEYVQARWRAHSLTWMRDLDRKSPTVLYRSGADQERAAPAGLCKLVLPTSDPQVSRLQRRTILAPAERLARIEEVVGRHMSELTLTDQPIVLNPAERFAVKRFAIPAHRFGHDHIMRVGGSVASNGGLIETQSIDTFARRRLQLVRSPSIGPVDVTPLGPQYLLLPQSLPREINDDFAVRLERVMSQVACQTYKPMRVIYDDRGATSLSRQVSAIKAALQAASITSGYALVVLPTVAHRDLHNYLKRTLWPNLQLQCAMASKVKGYYSSNGTSWAPAANSGRLDSYILNCALGLMVVNRKWLWCLEADLHYDVYIGIDVLNQMAGLTFLYQGGRHVFFTNSSVKQKERLSSRQVRGIIRDRLRNDLRTLALRPNSIVVHRDGRAFDSEIAGFRKAIEDLTLESLLPTDVATGVVEIRKTSTEGIRLFRLGTDGKWANPHVGTYQRLSEDAGVVCTTGGPFSFPGTVRPLLVHVADGQLPVEHVLEDVFCLSQLAFTAPDKCARLPMTIKLADDFLEPIAGEANDEEAEFESEDGDDEEAGDPASMRRERIDSEGQMALS